MSPIKSVFTPANLVRIRVAGSWPHLTLAAMFAIACWTLILFAGQGLAQTGAPAANAGKPASDALLAPAVLPGKGLAQHDFFYAGEAKEERMSIVRGGRVIWSYTHPGRGEISDAVLQPNGNILFAHQYGHHRNHTWTSKWSGISTLPRKPKSTPRSLSARTACGSSRTAIPRKFIVMNKASGKIEHQFELPVRRTRPASTASSASARLTAAGTILVAHMDSAKSSSTIWMAVCFGRGTCRVAGRRRRSRTGTS